MNNEEVWEMPQLVIKLPDFLLVIFPLFTIIDVVKLKIQRSELGDGEND